MGSKYSNIQGMRAIAALMVMFLHIAGLTQGLGFTSFLQPFQYIGFVGVDIFFVISGVVMTLTTYKHLGKPRHIFGFAKRRAIRIYSNYWLILLIVGFLAWLGWCSLRPQGEIFESIFLLPQRGKYQIIPVAWTLMYEMLFYFVFAFLIFFPQKYFLRLLILWFLVVFCANIFVIERIKGMPFVHNFYLSPLQLEFIAGCLVGWLVIKKIYIRPLTLLLLGGGLIICIACVTRAQPLQGHLYTLYRVIFYGSGAAMIIYSVLTFEVTKNWRMPRWLNVLGDASYTLYLIHNTILQVLVHLVYRTFVEPSNNVFLQQGFVVLSILTIVGYSVLHYRYLERPLLNKCNKILKRD
jgi:exopolysaccharide production protein ExoZ